MRRLRKHSLLVGITFVLSMAIACRHHGVTSTVPKSTPESAEAVSLQPDQVNTLGWDRAWTNLLNDVEESFVPSVPKLRAVEVELVVGNPEESEDDLTLTILDARGKVVETMTQKVQAKSSDHVMFAISADGVELSPGQTYWLRLAGGPTFGWKYVIGGYEKGEATFNGKPLLTDARSSFLFRTFGED